MPKYGFTYNGRHTNEFGLYVRTTGNVLLPARSDTRAEIPGRPGAIVFEGEPGNKIMSFLLTLPSRFSERRAAARDIAAWLSSKGELTMDYEPDKRYDVVRAVSGVSAAIDNGSDAFNVEFECEPYQRGEKRQYQYSGGDIAVFNGGTAPADTIITITGTGNITVAMGGQSFSLTNFSGSAIIDSRRMMVYTPGGQSRLHMHTGGFIRIPPGSGTISASGNISYLSVEFWEMWL